MRKRATFVGLLLAAVMSVQAVTPNMIKNSDQKACQEWVDSVYKTLSLRERVAQLVFATITPTQGAASKSSIKTFVEKDGVGGVLISEGSLEQHVEMINYAQSLAKVPLINTFDGEWGLAMRIKDTPKYPQNMGLGAISDTNLLYEYGREVARECRLVGVNVNFAPVADINSNPSNPVIGYRSFGEDPQRVAKLVVAYSNGLESGGVQAVAKHFPGHGDTSTDSHKASTVVNHSKQQMYDIDLVPFKSYISAGCSGVMVGHLSVPSLDISGAPASLSNTITTNILRQHLGFEGLIYTDALSMKGATVHSGSNAIAALQAGADVLLGLNNPGTEINTIVKAVNSGKISASTIENRCKRILTYKYLLGLRYQDQIDINGLSKKIYSPTADNVNRKLANASMTLLRNKSDLLPLRNLGNRSIAVVSIGEEHSDMIDMMKRYANVKTYHITSGAFSTARLAEIAKHDIVVAAVYSDKQWARHVVGQLEASKHLVVSFMINPYKSSKFKSEVHKAAAILFAYDNTKYTREASAQAIFGGIDVTGTLPVNLKGFANIGTGIKIKKTRLGFTSPLAEGMRPSLTDSIDSLINKCLKIGAFPGCQILVARNGNVVIDKCYGKLTAGGDDVKPQTVYDLASVSKAIGTLPGVMKVYDKGLLNLDNAASKYIPGLLQDEGKAKITVRELLYHESGMPASLAMYDAMMDTATYVGKLITQTPDDVHTIKIQNKAYGNKTAKLRTDILGTKASSKFPIEAAAGIFTGKITYDTIMQRIYTIPLRQNKSYNYSCLNFCLLMDAEQRLTGKSHDEFVKEEFWKPLGAYTMCYRPLTVHAKADIAPTEYDSFLRRQTVQGYVHDELCAFSGGVQGNAGLFANADDVAKMCQMWLNGGIYGGERLLSEATVKTFTTAKSPTCRRGLGFDKPDVKNLKASPTCDEASPETYGHLGFTGTVFWVDPKENLIFVFLNNRVNPTRDNSAFSQANIRPKLFSQVYKSLK
jgi:beta-glucosidase-like glycosyl hydrolase/CubicO group peptidase (beta-lactamase class C family)